MSYEQILTENLGEVCLLTLNRPDRLNAWTRQMGDELSDAIEVANSDPSVGAIVVTGAGRGFCAGADVEQAFGTRIEQGGEAEQPGGLDWVELVRDSKPLVAAINGVAVGVGITQVLPFDIILASSDAKVGMFFVRMGLVPELGSSHFLVQRVGVALASEMCLTGRLYRAEDLAGTGFFNAITEPAELRSTALEWARQIAANPAPSLRMIKQLLSQNGTESDLDAVQRRENDALNEAYETPEHREAVQAFMERRAPDFRRARSSGS